MLTHFPVFKIQTPLGFWEDYLLLQSNWIDKVFSYCNHFNESFECKFSITGWHHMLECNSAQSWGFECPWKNEGPFGHSPLSTQNWNLFQRMFDFSVLKLKVRNSHIDYPENWNLNIRRIEKDTQNLGLRDLSRNPD